MSSAINKWKNAVLGDFLKIKHGFAFKGKYFSDKAQFIVLTPGNFFDCGGFKKKDQEKYYTGDFPREYILNRNDLLIAMTEQMRGLLGSSILVPQNNLYLHNQRLGLIQDLNEKELDKYFLYYLFNSHNVRSQIQATANGAKVRHTSPSRIYTVQVSIPPLRSQKKIASLILAYDLLIENNKQKICILEEISKAVYNEWFCNFHFLGYRKVKITKSELGQAPAGWEICNLLNVKQWSFINESIGPFKGTKEYFATADVDGINIIRKGVSVVFNDKPSRAQKEPVLYSVWFARMKDTYKILAFTNVNIHIARNCILSSGFAGFKSNEESFPFLYYTINSKRFQDIKSRYCTGATQMSITNEGLSKIKIALPPLSIIRDYSKIVLPFIDEILLLQQKNSVLQQTRDFLMPQLISGQLDVEKLDIPIEMQDDQ